MKLPIDFEEIEDMRDDKPVFDWSDYEPARLKSWREYEPLPAWTAWEIIKAICVGLVFFGALALFLVAISLWL